MAVLKKGVKPTLVLVNLLTFISALLTLVVGYFNDNQVLLQAVLDPETFTVVLGVVGAINAGLLTFGKVKPLLPNSTTDDEQASTDNK